MEKNPSDKDARYRELMGELIDSVSESLSDISNHFMHFVDTCTIEGLVPPHPGDVARAIPEFVESIFPGLVDLNYIETVAKKKQEEKKEVPHTNVTAALKNSTSSTILGDAQLQSQKNELKFDPNSYDTVIFLPYAKVLPPISQHDMVIILNQAKAFHSNPCSSYCIERIKQKLFNYSTTDIRDYIRYLQYFGAIEKG